MELWQVWTVISAVPTAQETETPGNNNNTATEESHDKKARRLQKTTNLIFFADSCSENGVLS